MGTLQILYASSCAVYGDSTKLPLSESQNIHPISAYGPGQKLDSPYAGVITNFINTHNKKPLTIYGDGT